MPERPLLGRGDGQRVPVIRHPDLDGRAEPDQHPASSIGDLPEWLAGHLIAGANVTITPSDDGVTISSSGGAASSEWDPFLLLLGPLSIEQLIAAATWAEVINSGLVADHLGMWDIDKDAQTITAVPELAVGDIAHAAFVLVTNESGLEGGGSPGDYRWTGTAWAPYVAVEDRVDELESDMAAVEGAAASAQSVASAAAGAAAAAAATATAAQGDVDALGVLVVTRDFGAVGDGVADDTDAFDAAAVALTDGPERQLFVPPGDYRVRRTFVPPSGSTVFGVPGRSRLFRDPGIKAALAVDVDFDATEVTVVDPEEEAAGFAVGDDVIISDTGNWEWSSTHATVTAIDGNTLTIDNPTTSNYVAANGGTVYRCCSLVSNHPHHLNDALPDPAHDITIRGLVLDQNSGADDPHDEFTAGTVQWENAVCMTVEDCRVLNAVTDGISDQQRNPSATPGVGTDCDNRVTNCVVSGASRHGVHLGSNIRGAKVQGTTISDCGYMGLFLCANAQNSVITGNVIRDCAQGVGGADSRQADTGPITDATPYADILGDIANVVVGNTFVGGARSDEDGAPAITMAAQMVASGNTISNWNGGILVTPGSVDCVVADNVISFGPEYASATGIAITPGSHRAVVTGNSIRGGGFDVGMVKQEVAISVDDADHVTVVDNTIVGCMTAASIAGTLTGLSWRNNKLVDTRDTWGAIRLYGVSSDCDLDLTGFDPTANTSPAALSFHDGAGSGAQTRLRLNGIGDNGDDNPANGGAWNAAPSERYAGTVVTWDDGLPRVSQLVDGTWVAQASPRPLPPSSRCSATGRWVGAGLTGVRSTSTVTIAPSRGVLGHCTVAGDLAALAVEITAGANGDIAQIVCYADDHGLPGVALWTQNVTISGTGDHAVTGLGLVLPSSSFVGVWAPLANSGDIGVSGATNQRFPIQSAAGESAAFIVRPAAGSAPLPTDLTSWQVQASSGIGVLCAWTPAPMILGRTS